MFARWTARWKRLRRVFSLTEWAVWFLGLPRSATEPTKANGLILIQIDGLAAGQFRAALQAGRMPFCERLLRREHYRLHSLYSGLPSSTPSVQGELFYGVRCAVPAFGFRDHRSGAMVKMFFRDAATEVQTRIATGADPLLAGGSAYCNIYDGGAAEAHYCASSLGWSELLQQQRITRIALYMTRYSWSLVRTFGLMSLEFALALGGFLRGALSGREWWQEVMMIPARVVVVILMRELATIGAMMDAARGLPVIQLNYLGYDEQSHRRGPGSDFAHWTLKGIDAAIHRLWQASHHSERRHYDVWIYSDHGQEHTEPHQFLIGQTIRDAVAECAEQLFPGRLQASALNPKSKSKTNPRDEDTDPEGAGRRASWLGTGWLIGKLFGEDLRDESPHTGLRVASLGPLGLVYTGGPSQLRDAGGLQELECVALARRLVADYAVPMAAVWLGEDRQEAQILAITGRGEFSLPRDASHVFGANHPFLREVANDFVQLCRHPDAGDLVLSGWCVDCTPQSFVIQHGAHAGVGAQETSAFALLPHDATRLSDMAGKVNNYLRASDLRAAALRFLGRSPDAVAIPGVAFDPVDPNVNIGASSNLAHRSARDNPLSDTLRVMTYNVHACIGMDGRISPERIARVIAQTEPDVVALQELDVGRSRTEWQDQVQQIAHALEMECEFHPAFEVDGERYGDAVLSRLPLRRIHAGPLPSAKADYEPRGAQWLEVSLPTGLTVQILNTHLSIIPRERLLQADAIATTWVVPALKQGPSILCGDFNAIPRSPSYRRFLRELRDVQLCTANRRAQAPTAWVAEQPGRPRKTTNRGPRPAGTWFSPFPLARLDHIFVSPQVQVLDVKVNTSQLARVASDHLPLTAELRIVANK